MSGREQNGVKYTVEKPWCQPEYAKENPEGAVQTRFRAVLAFVVGLAIVVFLAGPWS